MSYLDTEALADQIITTLKSLLPAQLAAVDPTLEGIRSGTGGQEDSYYFGDVATFPIVFPAIDVRVRDTMVQNMDQSGSYQKMESAVELELVCGGEFEQTVNRNCYRYARAIYEVIQSDNTLAGKVALCEFQSILYSNVWKGQGGSNLYKAFIMTLRVIKI